jgi:hypothetical protein
MHLRVFAPAAAVCLTLLAFEARPYSQTPAARTIAIGDVHGAFEPFVEILQTAGLIDAKRQWAGGNAVLVQTGDVFDRGAGVRDALDLLMRLEGEARRAGGRVEPLLGNHEVMNLIGDLRDVSPEAYASFADNRSEDRRSRAYEDYLRIAKRRGAPGAPPVGRDEWMKAHPPGFVEYVEALGPRGRYGRWLRSHKVVLTLNGTAFMHAGVRADLPGTLDDVNRTVARELGAWDETKAMMVQAQLVPVFCTLTEAIDAATAELLRISAALKKNEAVGDHVTRELVDRLQALLEIGKWAIADPEGPLWFRGYATWAETDEAQASTVLQRFGVRRFVTGHTPSRPGSIKARFGGRFFLIDTGMLSTYYKDGRASALELQDDRATAIYKDGREPLVPAKAHLRREVFGRFPAGAPASPMY